MTGARRWCGGPGRSASSTSEPGPRPVPLVLAADEVAVFVVDLASETFRTPELLATLDPAEQAVAARFARPGDRSRYEAAHVGRRVVLAASAAAAMAAVTIARAACVRCGKPHGKPFLVERPELGFSLAHAGALALVAVAAGPVGVDVEPVDGRPAPNLARHICTPGELRALEGAGAGSVDVLRLWTRKEALLKATGEGLARDPRTVEVGPTGPVTVEGFRVTDIDVPVAGYVAGASWEGSGARRVRLGAVVIDGGHPACVLDR